MSRLIPFLLGYNEEDIDAALKTIRTGVNVFPKKRLDLDSKLDVGITDSQLDEIESIAKFVAKLNNDFTAFRSLKNIITFVKAHAILRQRNRVETEDITFLRACVPFWCDPAGDDAQFFILRYLPATVQELVQKLPYSQRLIYKKLEDLVQRKKLVSKGSDGRYCPLF